MTTKSTSATEIWDPVDSGSSEITDGNREWDISRKNIEDIMEALQIADQKPEGELEELCTAVLMALGFQSPGIAIFKLCDRWHNNLPPNCLLAEWGDSSTARVQLPTLVLHENISHAF